jgi:hypothetical protein
MNKQRMMDLAILIEGLPAQNVNMKGIINDYGKYVIKTLDSGVDGVYLCGTVGCVAGWAAIQSAQAKSKRDIHSFVIRAQAWLELLSLEADYLFYPAYSWGWGATPGEVAAVIRRAATDGSITNEVWRPLEPAPATTTTTSSFDQSQWRAF